MKTPTVLIYVSISKLSNDNEKQKGENVKFRLSEKYCRNKENTGKKEKGCSLQLKVCQSFSLQQLHNRERI